MAAVETLGTQAPLVQSAGSGWANASKESGGWQAGSPPKAKDAQAGSPPKGKDAKKEAPVRAGHSVLTECEAGKGILTDSYQSAKMVFDAALTVARVFLFDPYLPCRQCILIVGSSVTDRTGHLFPAGSLALWNGSSFSCWIFGTVEDSAWDLYKGAFGSTAVCFVLRMLKGI